MAKRKSIPGQLGFAFDTPHLPTLAGALAGDAQGVAEMVSDMLKQDPRRREIIAAEMSALLGEDISKNMLDAYASPSRSHDHSISWPRLKALVAVTSRHDLLDADLRSIGAALLVGEEIAAARVGHLRAHIAQLQQELRDAERNCQPISRGSPA